MLTPLPHQIEGSKKAFEILRSLGIVYLVWEERTGKTLTAILTCCLSSKVTKVLVITKKKALDGWKETLANYPTNIEFVVTNYHQANKIQDLDHQIVILDESHAYLGSYPKPGAMWKAVAPLTKDKFIIFLSATPAAQGSANLFHQFKLSTWSPWAKFRTFYDWFRQYGIPKVRYLGSRSVNVYDTVDEVKVSKDVDKYMLSCSRQEIGFKHEPKDVVHYVQLDETTKEIYRKLEKTQVLALDRETIVADTPMSMLTKLHQIEGGTIKGENGSYNLLNREKIDYILRYFGDRSDLVIFYHYKQEKIKLESVFKNALILQGVSFAEGVDLSHYEHLVVYSMNFSTAQYNQRRARQANIKRESEIKVHFLCVKGALSDQVYRTVALNKQNFIDSMYQNSDL